MERGPVSDVVVEFSEIPSGHGIPADDGFWQPQREQQLAALMKLAGQ